MEYHGKLYGKIGNKYFDTDKTSKDFYKMAKFLLDIYEQEEGISQSCHDELYEFLTKIEML